MRKRLLYLLATVFIVVGLSHPAAMVAGDESRTSSRAFIPEIEGPSGNGDFNTSQEYTTAGDVVQGHTGVTDVPSPNDCFKFKPPIGFVIKATVHLTTSSGWNDQVVHVNLYDPTFNKVAWSQSGHVYESVTAVTKYDKYEMNPSDTSKNYYYLMLIPWKGTGIDYDMNISWYDPPSVSEGDMKSGVTSNSTWVPAEWYKMTLNGGATSKEVGNATARYNVAEVQNDLYFRDLYPNLWSWWYNWSWDGEWKQGLGGQVEEVDAAASYNGLYYWDVQAWNGSGSYTLEVHKKSTWSDGDDTFDTAVEVKRAQGQTQAIYTGTVDSAYDKYDFYKVNMKKGESMNATMYLQSPWTFAIYRTSIYTINASRAGGYEVWSTWTNVRNDNVMSSAAASVLDAPYDGWYYIQLMAQLTLDPANKSNAADWHINYCRGNYILKVDLPDRDHAPIIKDTAPKGIIMNEDEVYNSLNLADVFSDQDTGDAELQDNLTFTVPNMPEHLNVVANGSDQKLMVTPEADWNGMTSVVIRATDLYGKFVETNLSVTVNGVNDAPRVDASIVDIMSDFHVEEGEVNQTWDGVTLVEKQGGKEIYHGFVDPDVKYGGEKLTFTVTSNESATARVPTQIQEDDTHIFIKYGPAEVMTSQVPPEHKVQITVKATDIASESVPKTINVTIHEKPGAITCKEYMHEMFEAPGRGVSNTSTLDLNTICADSKNNKLTFQFNKFLTSDSRNVTVSNIGADGKVTFTAKNDYNNEDHGIVNNEGEKMEFRAYMDSPFQISTTFQMTLFIFGMPDAPNIVANTQKPVPTSTDETTVAEGGNLDFSVQAEDIDSPIGKLIYNWYVKIGDNDTGPKTDKVFTYKPDYDSAGTVSVRCRIIDPDGLYIDALWPTVTVTDSPRKPVVHFSYPQNNTPFSAGQDIEFLASAYDEDGDPVTFTWYDGSQVIHEYGPLVGTENEPVTDNFKKSLKAGETHIITLEVKDDNGQVAKVMSTVIVQPKKASGGTGIPGYETGAVMVAIVLVGVVMAAMRRKDE